MKLKLKIFTCLCLLPIFSGNVNAQTLITPNNSDNTQFTTLSGIAGYNTAMMAYDALNPKYFFATAAWSGPNRYIYVTDPSLSTTTATVVSTGQFNGPPDVVIGDNNTGFGTPGVNFILATVFTNTNGDLEIDYYDVNDNGSTIAIQPLASLDPSLPNKHIYTPTNAMGDKVHADIVADYSNTSVTGLPFCDQFVVTWVELVGGGPNKQVFAALCDLNSQSFGTPQLMNTSSGTGQYGELPDVAAVRRVVAGPSDYTAWVTYWDNANSSLCLTEYDFSTNAVLSQVVLDNLTPPLTLSDPRIDAYDNYSTLGSPAHYKVVAAVGGTEIRNYDNNLYAGSTYYVSSQFIDVTTVGSFPWTSFSPPYTNYFPTVAAGGQDYNVFHACEVASNNRIMFMEPVNEFTSIIPSTGHYYWVNGTSSPLSAISNSLPNASVSSPANRPGLASVYAWMNGNSLKYKISTPTYGFRPPQIDGSEPAELSVKVYPNPANSELIITGRASKNNGYTITDMAGRVLQQGATSATGNSNVNIGSLAAGNYAISLHENGEVYATRIFVKN